MDNEIDMILHTVTTGSSIMVTSLPTVLFAGGSRIIVEGSVVWLYCQVNSKGVTVTGTWTKDNVSLVQDVPHIRTRTSRGNDDTTFLLVMDTFQGSDSGVYQCTAEEGGEMAMGTALTLTGRVDNQCCHVQSLSIQCTYSIHLNYWIPSIYFR